MLRRADLPFPRVGMKAPPNESGRNRLGRLRPAFSPPHNAYGENAEYDYITQAL